MSKWDHATLVALVNVLNRRGRVMETLREELRSVFGEEMMEAERATRIASGTVCWRTQNEVNLLNHSPSACRDCGFPKAWHRLSVGEQVEK